MKTISMIIGYRKTCYYCRARIRLVLVPALGDRWQPCEDFVTAPDQLELHDCPKHPSREAL